MILLGLPSNLSVSIVDNGAKNKHIGHEVMKELGMGFLLGVLFLINNLIGSDGEGR